jgi:hypothetical protein
VSLPKYIVNWDELLDLFKDKIDIDVEDIGLGDLEDYLNEKLGEIIDLLKQILDLLTEKGLQRIHSMAENIPAMVGTYKFSKTFDTDILLTGITYSQSAWKNQDSWDLEVGGRLLFDDIATKELGEHKNFNVFYLVPAGTPVNILYHNTSGNSRIVWFDIEYIDLRKEIVSPHVPTGTVIINYITEEGRLIDSDIKDNLSIRSHVFMFKYIKGYESLEPTSKSIALTEDNPVQIIEFIYRVLKGTIIVKHRLEDGTKIGEDEIYRDLELRQYTFGAITVEGYRLREPGNNTVTLEVTSENNQIEYTFIYEKLPEDIPPIENDYDWMVVLRWQDNSSTDLDLHLYIDCKEDEHVYHANKEYKEDENNKIWLNYDFRGHDNNGRKEQPEIITILGMRSHVINLFVTNYNRGYLTEETTIDIYKKEQGKDRLIHTTILKQNEISNDGTIYIGNIKDGQFIPIKQQLSYRQNSIKMDYCRL